MKKIKIFLVDDHTIVREGFKSILQENPGYLVSGTAANGREAIDKIGAMEFKPDIILMDVKMPEMDGIDCTAHLTNDLPDIKVIVLTMVENSAVIKKILQAGAVGYFLKSGSRDELYMAIDQVHQGKSYFTPSVSSWILSQMTRLGEPNSKGKLNLTSREKEVLTLIVKDVSNHEIAEKLGISIRTVETHKQNLIAKTGTRSVAGLVVRALEEGLVSAENTQ